MNQVQMAKESRQEGERDGGPFSGAIECFRSAKLFWMDAELFHPGEQRSPI